MKCLAQDIWDCRLFVVKPGNLGAFAHFPFSWIDFSEKIPKTF